MSTQRLTYPALSEIDPKAITELLNQEKIREHLLPHAQFDAQSTQEWINGKQEEDKHLGCRIRGVLCNGHFVGWCGLQYHDDRYELALILAPSHWGLGYTVFKQLMLWAKELGHKEVVIHFLHTRPEYRFLRKRAKAVYETDIQGHRFLSYLLPVTPLSSNEAPSEPIDVFVQ